jgi:hypothetical protein
VQKGRSNKQIHLKIENEDFQQTKELIYLGSIFFPEECKIDREIETGMQNANNVIYLLTPLLKHPEIAIPSKRQIIKRICTPTLCYESQTWTLNQAQTQQIQTCEMPCLRKKHK